MTHDPSIWLTIGKLSRATGIPTETIRTWEKRYGAPAPERTQTNRRIYNKGVVEQLKLVKQAIDQGLRARDMLALEVEQLREALEQTSSGASTDPSASAHTLRAWMDLIKQYDADALMHSMRRTWYAHGVLVFLDHYMGPLLTMIGEQWASQELGVRHEHFASEHIRDFLASQWRSMSQGAQGPQVICTTLPGQRHQLGLHMVASAAALSGCRVLFLGADTPLEEILHTAHTCASARALCVSCATGAQPEATQRALAHLSEQLPQQCALIVGGAGSPEDAKLHAMKFDSFHQMAQWCARQLGVKRPGATLM